MVRILLWWFVLFRLASAEPVTPGGLRCSRNGQGQLIGLESVVRCFRHPTRSLQVDLVATVHVGEAAYYRGLNRLLGHYDAVLYELIAESAGGRPQPLPATSAGLENPLSATHQGLAELLGLKMQLEVMDYSPANFVHADVSPAEMQAALGQNRPSLWATLKGAFGRGRRAHPEVRRELDQVNLVQALMQGPEPAQRYHLRRATALMLCDPSPDNAWLQGPGGVSLVAARNQRALQVLRRQLEGRPRRVALLFGAAHVPGLQRQLKQELGLRYHSQSWRLAWHLRSGGQN